MGFRRFQDFNSALVAKLAWKVGASEQSPWVSLLKHKYCKNEGSSSHSVKNGDSCKGILSARDVIRTEACAAVGNGMSLRVWGVLLGFLLRVSVRLELPSIQEAVR